MNLPPSMGRSARGPEYDSFQPDREIWIPERTPLLRAKALQDASPERQRHALVDGFYAFQLFTLTLENEPVEAICRKLRLQEYGALFDSDVAEVAFTISSQEIEHGHAAWYQIHEAARVSGMPPLQGPSALVRRLAQLEDSLPCADRFLALPAFSIGSETLVTGTLSGLANDERLQPAIRAAMAIHHREEALHSRYFGVLCAVLAERLPSQQRARFADLLIEGLALYLAPDRGVLLECAVRTGLPRPRAIVDEVLDHPETLAGHVTAARPSIALFRRLGLVEDARLAEADLLARIARVQES